MAGTSGWTCRLPGPGSARRPWRGPGPTGGAAPRPAPGGLRARSHPTRRDHPATVDDAGRSAQPRPQTGVGVRGVSRTGGVFLPLSR